MKLILIGCLLASGYSANLEAHAGPQGQYFERTPNNNFVQIKYIGAGSGLNNAAFNSQNQRTGNFNQESNNQQSQNQVNSQKQILTQINQQDQGLDQFSQDSSQGNQNLNQVAAQFAQQNQRFSVNTEQFSFNNNQFANPNLVEVSFDENRHQQFIANQERQRQQFQTQPNQGQDFQNQQRQRQQQGQRQQQLQHQQQQQQQRNRQQQTQQKQLNNQEHQRLTQVSQTQVQNRNPFSNGGFQQHLSQVSQTQVQNRNPSTNGEFQQQSSRPQNNLSNNLPNRIIPVPERIHSGSVVPQSKFQEQRHVQSQGPRINHIHNQFQFPQPIRTQLREIAGHLQRVDSDEIIGIFQPFTIPASASLFEGNVNSQFYCARQGQGFYADPSSNCQQFHVCTSVQGRNTPDLYRFTFQCADGEYFDQSALTCLGFAGHTSSRSCAASPYVYQSSKIHAQQLFSAFSSTPYSQGSTPPGICYLANYAQFVTGIRRK